MKKSILILGLFLSSCGVFRKSPLLPLAEKTGSYDKVKFYKTKGRPYIQAFVNGKKANLLLDTGFVGHICILSKSLQKFGFTKNGKGYVEQAINFKISNKMEPLKPKDVSILKHHFTPKKLDGLTGYGLFLKTKAIIDYRNRMLFFAKGDEVKKTNLDTILIKKGYSKIPLQIIPLGIIFCDAYFNGVKTAAVLDTGATHDVIGIQYKEEFDLKINEKIKINVFSTVNVNSGKTTTKDNTLRLGNITFKNRRFMLMDFEPYNKLLKQRKAKKEMKTVIGEKTLWKLHAIIDYGNHVLYIKK